MKVKHTHFLFCAESPDTLRIFFGTVDQLRLFGIMLRSGCLKILIWQIPLPSRQLFASA